MRKALFVIAIVATVCISVHAAAAVREYSLTIAEEPVEIAGKTTIGITINGGIPGPTLFFKEGDVARIKVTNTMDVPSSIHWHGMLVPPLMDGVPFITQAPIKPGTTFIYEFPIRQTGTYWYHSHSELQEQRGLYGSIVIADQERADRDYVVLLSDWTTVSPSSILRTLKRGSEWFSLQRGSAQSIFGAAKAGRLGDYFKRELQRMPPMDIADVAYDYFLSNGKPEQYLEAGGGETVRLRIINGSATTFFHINFAGGPLTIISSDGQLVEPVRKDLFLIGVAETYDVLLTLPADGAYEMRATAHDGSGFASTWLGSGKKHGAIAVPKPNLYAAMQHGGSANLFALTPAGVMGMSDDLVAEGRFDKPGMAHGGHAMAHGSQMMMGADHSAHMAMPAGQPGMPGKEESESPQDDELSREIMAMTMDDAREADTAVMHHGHEAHRQKSAPAVYSAATVEEISPANRYGARFGFLEADIGSRENLAVDGSTARPFPPYADLKSRVVTTLPVDAPVRELRFTLDGDMERYTWFLNNRPLSETDHILIKEGEVVRFIMINRTMMHHPMHLHGHFFRVINGQGARSPLKHTVDVAPMETTVIEFYGNEKGDWFFHCHLLYHMKAGMARMVHYHDFTSSEEVLKVRRNLYRDPFYFYGQADVLSNMTEGALHLSNSRYEFQAAWEVGWHGVEDTDWEGLLTGDYHLNRFTSFFLGADALGENSSTDDFRGIAGIRYLLPLNIHSTLWADSDGGGRVMLKKEFELTPRLGLHGEVEYDTHEQWEGEVGLVYMVSKEFSLIVKYHSEFEFGAGLQIRF